MAFKKFELQVIVRENTWVYIAERINYFTSDLFAAGADLYITGIKISSYATVGL